MSDQITGTTAADIADSVRGLRERGVLRAGSPLPPVRELATTLGVNRNTAVAAYRQLAQAGLVISRGRAGTVIAGLESVAQEGYAVVVLLDTWLLLARDSMRAAEEALRRWSNAVALLRPGGRALAVGEPAEPALQALVRWDQPGFAGREAADRREARLPPATRVAVLRAGPGALDDALTLLALPEHGDVLGPLAPLPGSADDEERAVVRVPRAGGAALSAALGELQRVRSARKLDPVRNQVDPMELL